MEAPKFLGVFNLPGGKVTQGRRDVTNVPAQALALLNDPFVLQQADVLGRAAGRPDRMPSVAERIEHVFRVALGRPPTQDERERFRAGRRPAGRASRRAGSRESSRVEGSGRMWPTRCST